MGVVERTRNGPVIRARAKPNARKDAVVSVAAERLVVAVRAAPEQGKANAAVVKALARWLGVAPSALEILTGAGARDKRVLVHGATPEQIEARIRALTG